MKKLFLILLILLFSFNVCQALLIDDFEDGSIKLNPEWWTFDIQKCQVASNESNKTLLLQGKAKNWYAGGIGTYLAKEKTDLSKYQDVQLDVYGHGAGTLKIELADDDNGNWDYEQDPNNNWNPIYDDRWIYEQRIDWRGWKTVKINFNDFVDDNPLVGDDIFNIEQANGSGGLLQMQFICIGNKADSNFTCNIDNINLVEETKEVR